MPLYSDADRERIKSIFPRVGSEDFRNEFRRDYGRLIHSPSFRRLQGKTQLFPGIESDFFRNRLTHSIEVAQIAKSIAMKLNSETPQLDTMVPDQHIDLDLVEIAALAHDIGHPPFGHNGEAALDDCMKYCGGFEGNAQTLRILSKLEKKQEAEERIVPVDSAGKDQRRGLNLTFRSLASVLKYDSEIKLKRNKSQGLSKGYYQTERDLVAEIKKQVAPRSSRKRGGAKFRTVECWIMDTADDIAYSTYDLEDALKGGFISPLRLISMIAEDQRLLKRITTKVNESLRKIDEHTQRIDEAEVLHRVDTVFSRALGESAHEDENEVARTLRAYTSSNSLTINGYLRSDFTGELVNEYVKNIQIEFDEEFPALSKVYLTEDTRITVEVLKHMTYEIIIMSPRLKIVEHRGYELVKTIFETLNSEDGHLLLPDDFKTLYEKFSGTDDKMRAICDFVAGMTDRYALEFYSRLKETGQSIFKPF